MARTPQELMDEHIHAMSVSHHGRQTVNIIKLAGQVNFYEEYVPKLEARIRDLEAQVRDLEAQVQFLTPPTKKARARQVPPVVTAQAPPEARNGG